MAAATAGLKRVVNGAIWPISAPIRTSSGMVLLGNAAGSAARRVARAVRDQWLHLRGAALAAIVRQAVAQGEIRAGTDVDVIVDALVSPPYYRLLFALSPLDDAALNDLLETVWRGCRRSDARPSTAHAVAAARSIRASSDQRAPTKPRLKKKT